MVTANSILTLFDAFEYTTSLQQDFNKKMDIEKKTRQFGKTYHFDDQHEAGKPAQYWFQNPPEGFTLFIVFYTMACRWSKCLGCNLPSKMSKDHIPFDRIMAQVDYLFHSILTEEQKRDLKKIILSNNGSILDEATFSTTALIYFIANMNLYCPNVSLLCMETRPEYIDWHELEFLSTALKEGHCDTELEIAIGFEAYDDAIRNDHFQKGMPLEIFESMVMKLVTYGFKLKTYFMMKPVPGISEEDGIKDIIDAIDYLNGISEKHSIDINMHLNPTYAAVGTELEKLFLKGEYSPPLLDSVRKAVLHAKDSGISIYVGLDDEGLAAPGGGFIRKGDKKLVKTFEEFNATQDFSLLF